MADFSILSRKKLLQWLATLSLVSRLLTDLFGNSRDGKKREFKCACIPVEVVIQRHSKQYADTCQVSDQLPTTNK